MPIDQKITRMCVSALKSPTIILLSCGARNLSDPLPEICRKLILILHSCRLFVLSQHNARLRIMHFMSLTTIVCNCTLFRFLHTQSIALLQWIPWITSRIFGVFYIPCGASAFILLPVLPIRSLLLCRDKDGVDVVEDRQWTSLLMLEDSLALLDRLYRLSVFRERLKRLRMLWSTRRESAIAQD